MIYDSPVKIFSLPDGEGVPTASNLLLRSQHYGAELAVYSTRYWQSVQAGSSVDRMVELPLHCRHITGAMFAMIDRNLFSIEQVQFERDRDNLPITVLSLKRYLANLDPGGGTT